MIDRRKIEQPFSPPWKGNWEGVVYFIGIGGIGMSAIARFFHTKGVKVSGYDKTRTMLTRELEAAGIPVHYQESVDLIPKEVDLVVYTPAIPQNHAELEYYRKGGYRIVKRSDILNLITESSFNICVAGTHGKTTITTMVAHLLRHSGFGCNAFLGGISVNYGTNFWSSEKNVCVVEADEYDRSFLKLDPDMAIISAMDADHLDIYGTATAMEDAFIEFSGRIRSGGTLVRKFGLPRGRELKAAIHLTYSLQNESADGYAANIRMVDGGYEFDVMLKGMMLDNVRLHMGGMHNVENAVAAIMIASALDIDAAAMKDAIAEFRGIRRRFEYVIKKKDLVFVDDYAHHPEELRALITGARTLFGGRRCTVIFQPHLFSRTRDHAKGFSEVLDLADRIILLPIYPARELPVEGVNSEMILERMKKENKMVMTKDQLLEWVRDDFSVRRNREFGELLITAGAGDIDALVGPIREMIEKNS